jgi:hypothetical protein
VCRRIAVQSFILFFSEQQHAEERLSVVQGERLSKVQGVGCMRGERPHEQGERLQARREAV